MAAAPAHYIRTIHTSFTASPAWSRDPFFVRTPSLRRIKFDPFADELSYHPPLPYTIHIPPAAPADIQRHRRRQQESFLRRSYRSAPPPVPTTTTAVVYPTKSTATALQEREARSKIVAGILLNRVHAVGKPMRRRASDTPRPYVPSGLSTCVSIEA
ncbi:hypothetical protein AGABI1DRAFT_125755 [Agaricus bisporus var. burnettii JB137-S8]|uniref:Uncharacterized protein n=2 Tax=Agaricus bisporus var. burnettii TaxID=192524 RepID=K5XII0_AGABU|nr:uncharacterized protein AGABI1DRAFT_125755 [Agaricus bisporus var. burnettii JB137-S8]EKM83298.1 hypothetical protein AGABI1DRAFT_125755 [Agaricus bisporus var. burnettii JB137-S8]KAF7777910.1 hypothetical protein Agabi119p4_3982 [Agaricus bisporus var. burnettii]